MAENEKYPGCRPGWEPDRVLAERVDAPAQSVEDQVKAEQERWKLMQAEQTKAPAETVPAAPEDDELEEDDEDS